MSGSSGQWVPSHWRAGKLGSRERDCLGSLQKWFMLQWFALQQDIWLLFVSSSLFVNENGRFLSSNFIAWIMGQYCHVKHLLRWLWAYSQLKPWPKASLLFWTNSVSLRSMSYLISFHHSDTPLSVKNQRKQTISFASALYENELNVWKLKFCN